MKIRLAKKYFTYLAKNFPVMCASGAFPLFPPVAESSKRLDRLDDLSGKGIAKHVKALKKFKADFLAAAAKTDSPESEAQAQALALSAGGIVTELEGIRTWEKCPELYIQIAFTGLEQAVDMPAKNERERQKRFIKRLRDVSGLLAHAPKNIEAINSSSKGISQTMIRDCARFLTTLGQSDIGRAGKVPRFLAEVISSLKEFDKFVTTRPEIPNDQGPPFSMVTENVLGSDKTPDEIYSIAEEEYTNRLKSLRWFESEIGNGASWRELYEGYAGPPTDGLEALDLIIREIHRLRAFVQESSLSAVYADTGLRIDPQPQHLASTLRPIHLDPALGAWEHDPSRCYVSPQLFSGRRFRDNPALLARIRKEFPFLAAMETYPGRHLLDSQRRALGESPLSQITNPLFMAGWLAFAENLLDELGYLETPLARLAHHQRGLRRAALAMIDAGLAMGTMDQDRCLEILDETGFSREEGLSHVRAIRLAPSSEAMHILGLHEITQLRKRSRMDLGPFCTALFAGGQLSFAHIERRICG